MRIQGVNVAPRIPQTSKPGASRIPRWTIPLLWAIAAVAVFCWLGQEAAIEGEYIATELGWMAQVFSWRNPALTIAMQWVARVHDPVVIGLFAGLVGLHIHHKRWHELQWLVITVPGGMLVNLALKGLFQRPRPELHSMVYAHGYSFPSGHTVAATLVVGWLICALLRQTQSLSWRAAGVTAGVAVVIAVAFSRVYLGVHYPTDVLAAVLSGAAWVGICHTLQIAGMPLPLRGVN